MTGKINEEIMQRFLIEFGENFKKIRLKKKLSQTIIASRINGDEKKIGRIERGEYNFGIASILILAYALDVKVCELISIDNIEFLKTHIWEV